MGFKFALTGFPLFVLIISIVFQAAGAGSTTLFSASKQPPVAFGQSNSGITQITCNDSTVCSPSGLLPPNTVFTCQGAGGLPCPLFKGCGVLTYQGTYCINPLSPTVHNPADPLPSTFFNDGNSITVSPQGQASSSQFTFGFGAIGADGFIAIMIIAVSVAALMGANVVGSGENAEGTHILWMGGILLGIWAIVSAAEGVLIGSANSFFVQLDGAFGGMGSLLYIVLTFVYAMGLVSAVSRGGT